MGTILTCIVNENTNANLALEAYADFLSRSKNKGRDTSLVIATFYHEFDTESTKIKEL